MDKVVAKLKPKKEWRLDEEREKKGENVPDSGKSTCRPRQPTVGLRRGTGRRSLNSRDAQVFTPIKKERRRSWAYMGRLERKPLYKAENLEGLHCGGKGEPPTCQYRESV